MVLSFACSSSRGTPRAFANDTKGVFRRGRWRRWVVGQGKLAYCHEAAPRSLCPSPSSTSLTGVCVRVLNVVPQEGDDGSIARLGALKGDNVAKLGCLERADEGMAPEHFLGLWGEEGRGQRQDERGLSAF